MFSPVDEYPRPIKEPVKLLYPETYGIFSNLSPKNLGGDETNNHNLKAIQAIWDAPLKTQRTEIRSDSSGKPPLLFADADIISTSQAQEFVQRRYPQANITLMTDQTLQNNGCAVFLVQSFHFECRVCRIFSRAQPWHKHTFDLLSTIFLKKPSFYPTILELPQTHNDIFFVEEKYEHKFHKSKPLLDMISMWSYAEQGAKSLCKSLGDCLAFFQKHNFASFDVSATNFRVWREGDGFHVCPIDLRSAVSMDLIDDAFKEGDRVDFLRAGLLKDTCVPELHALQTHLDRHPDSQAPFTYIPWKAVDVFNLGVTWLQVILQEPNANAQMRSVIQQVTPDECGDLDEKSGEDCYFVRMADVLDRLFRDNAVCLADDVHRAQLKESFLDDVFGCIEKMEIEQYKSEIVSSRLTVEEALESVISPDVSFLGYICEETDELNEMAVRRLLAEMNGVEQTTKRSNGCVCLGTKTCMTIQAEIDNKPAIFRIFFKDTNRGQHVLQVYSRIQDEQDQGNAEALVSFPRVHEVKVYANIFVVREEWIEGMDLLDYINKNVLRIPQGPDRKIEQVSLMDGVCRAVALLHRWNIAHCDISADNFMVNKQGVPMLVDMESAVTFCGTDLFEFSKLNIWDKRAYRAPEVEYLKWKKVEWPEPPEIYVSLRASDVYSVAVLEMQTLTLCELKREGCLIHWGKNNTALLDESKFFEMIRGCLAGCSYGTNETQFENEILCKVFGERFWVDTQNCKEFVYTRRPTMEWMVQISAELLRYWSSQMY